MLLLLSDWLTATLRDGSNQRGEQNQAIVMLLCRLQAGDIPLDLRPDPVVTQQPESVGASTGSGARDAATDFGEVMRNRVREKRSRVGNDLLRRGDAVTDA
jgi:hypothetical protein